MKTNNINDKDYEIIADFLYKKGLFPLLFNNTFFITGSTGLLGNGIAKTLITMNKKYGLKAKIILHGRNKNKLNQLYSDFLNDDMIEFVVGDIRNPISFDKNVNYFFHCASETASLNFVNCPIETMSTLLFGTKNVLDLSLSFNNLKSFVFLSSLEIYGLPYKFDVCENDYGYIDILNARSSYSEGKRAAECLCYSYFSERKVPIKIARLSQIMGFCASSSDNRAYAQFARSVVSGQQINLKTKGETIRNYCDFIDAITAIIIIAALGKSGEAYNVANENMCISIYDLAKRMIELFPGSPTKIIIEEKDAIAYGYNPILKIKLTTKKLENIGWNPLVDMDASINRTLNSMKEII